MFRSILLSIKKGIIASTKWLLGLLQGMWLESVDGYILDRAVGMPSKFSADQKEYLQQMKKDGKIVPILNKLISDIVTSSLQTETREGMIRRKAYIDSLRKLGEIIDKSDVESPKDPREEWIDQKVFMETAPDFKKGI